MAYRVNYNDNPAFNADFDKLKDAKSFLDRTAMCDHPQYGDWHRERLKIDQLDPSGKPCDRIDLSSSADRTSSV